MGVRLLILCTFLVVNGLLTYTAIWGTHGLLEHRELRRQQLEAEAECKKLDAENMALSREIRLLQTDTKYMEKVVRERLHYLHKNEILYLFGDDTTDAAKREPHPQGSDTSGKGAGSTR